MQDGCSGLRETFTTYFVSSTGWVGNHLNNKFPEIV